MLNDLKVAFAFLTRIPIKHNEKIRLERSAGLFPAVGLFIGIISGISYYLGMAILDPIAAAAITVTLSTLLTGAFHLDGLADISDGLVGGWNKVQRLQILKDSRHGTYGVVAIVLQLILQVALLSSFTGKDGFWVLIVAHSLARVTPVFLMLLPAAPGHEGMGASISKTVKLRDLLMALIIAIPITFYVNGFGTILLIITLIFVNMFFALWVIRKIGGLLGDAFGASEQISETSILLYFSLISSWLGTVKWNL